MSRITRDEQMMYHAIIASLRSTCGRRQVGAILAQEGRIISTGYAGPPAGSPHCTIQCLRNSTSGCQRTIHAEANSIAFAAKRGISTDQSTLYCTLSPCLDCAKLLINSGIVRVNYLEPYRITEGITLLESEGIPCSTVTVSDAIYMSLRATYAFQPS